MNKVVDWLEVIWTAELPSNSKYVAAYLRTYMNAKRDLCWPSVGRISRETGLSEQTVRTHLKSLEGAGYLQIDRSIGGHSTGTNKYRAILPIDTLALNAPLQPLDPTPATVAPPPLQPLDPNIQGNKQGNIQIIYKDKCPDDLSLKAVKYWLGKGAELLVEDQWILFCAHHKSKPNKKINDYSAAWQTWYVNAVRFNQNTNKKKPAMERLQDQSWAAGIITNS